MSLDAVPDCPFLLNTRPILNFLGCDRFDVVSAVLGHHVCITPSILRELRECLDGFTNGLKRRASQRGEYVHAQELVFVENLRRWDKRLVSSYVRRIDGPEPSEIDSFRQLKRKHRRIDIDPGESEIIAVAHSRGWGIVIDERPARFYAESLRIPNESTVSILVRAVHLGCLSAAEGELIWEKMQTCWDYAPVHPLSDYVNGRPIWSLD